VIRLNKGFLAITPNSVLQARTQRRLIPSEGRGIISTEQWTARAIFTACGAKADDLIGGAFNRERTSQALGTMVTAINAYCDARIAAVQQELFRQQGEVPACRAGCAYCCHVPVHLTPVELCNIALFLDSSAVSAAQRAALQGRIDARVVFVGTLPVQQQPGAVLPCAFLVDDCCSIHPVRPLFCRGRNAIDRLPCLASYAHPDQPVPMQMLQEQILIGQSLVMGILEALKKIGLPDRCLDLSLATAVALATPDLVERWLRGENPLREC